MSNIDNNIFHSAFDQSLICVEFHSTPAETCDISLRKRKSTPKQNPKQNMLVLLLLLELVTLPLSTSDSYVVVVANLILIFVRFRNKRCLPKI